MNVNIVYSAMCIVGVISWDVASFVIDGRTPADRCIRFIGFGITALVFVLFILMRIWRKKTVFRRKTEYYCKLVESHSGSGQGYYVLTSDDEVQFSYADESGDVKSALCSPRRVFIDCSRSNSEANVKIVLHEYEYQYKFLFIRWPPEFTYTGFYVITIPEGSIAKM